MTPHIVPLVGARAAGPAVVGGKALGLGELLHAGCDVPPGFVITTAAYRAQLARLDPATPAAGPGALRAALAAGPLGDELRQEIGRAYRSLVADRPGVRVAVRSSATLEDLAEASFAGQYETTLGVGDEAALEDAVRRCWASLWGAPAVEYRRRHGLADDDAALAVVVQAQVEADVAGVLFTVDPLDGDRGLLVNAAYGLGESVVSGLVTPDTFHLARDGRLRRPPEVGAKEFMLVSDGAGVARREVPRELRARPCLTPPQLAELARAGVRLELRAGAPLDIEWAFAEGRLFLLQARAVTRPAYVEPDVPPPRGPRGAFLRRLATNFSDHFPEPLTPLDFSTVVRAAFVGISEAVRHLGLRPPAPEDVVREGALGESLFTPRPPRPTLRLLGLPLRVARLVHSDLEAEWRTVDQPFLEARVAQLDGTAHEALGDSELIERVLLAQDTLERGARRRFRVYFLPGFLHTFVLSRLVRLALGREQAPAALARLLGGLDHHMDRLALALAEVARQALASPELAAALRDGAPDDDPSRLRALPGGDDFARALAEFLACHGDRPARGMVPVPGSPTWRERPQVVLGMLRALLREPQTAVEAGARAAARQAAAAREVDEVAARLARGLPGRLGCERAFARSLREARAFLRVRDASLRLTETGATASRDGLHEVGRRLAARGLLDAPDDVFLLRLDELRPVLDGRLPRAQLAPRLLVRRAQLQGWERRARAGRNWFLPLLGLEPPGGAPRATGAGEATLSGLAASAGVARGPARLVLGQEQFDRLRRGDVLVCPSTAPAWTPLFSLAAAVVTDIGGPLSHAAIVAREYGLPAVLGTGCATRVLRDGEPLEVDGSSGRVTRMGGPTEAPAAGAPARD